MKRILIYKCHHDGNSYFDASSQELLEKSCLYIFNKYLDWDKNYDKNFPIIQDIKKPTFDENQIKNLPNGLVKDSAIEERENYKLYLKENAINEKAISIIKEIRENNNGKAAQYFLQKYENFELEDLTEI